MISTLPPLVRNNGGGFWNHDFFWKIMGPKGSTQPSGALKDAVDAYGGLDKLKEDFNAKGVGPVRFRLGLGHQGFRPAR